VECVVPGNSHQNKVFKKAVQRAVESELERRQTKKSAIADQVRDADKPKQFSRSSIEAYVFFLASAFYVALSAFGITVNFFVGAGILVMMCYCAIDLLWHLPINTLKVAKAGITAVLVIGAMDLTRAGWVRTHLQSESNDPALVNLFIQKVGEIVAKQPAPIVNIPSPPQHTHVSYDSPIDLGRSLGLPDLTLRPGEAPVVPIGFRDAGDFPVQEPQDAALIMLVPFKDVARAFSTARKKLKFFPPGGTIVSKSNQGAYHTFTGPVLTQSDVQKIQTTNLSEKVYLCAFGAVLWKDATGRYETDFARCATGEDGKSANWHDSKEDNEEHKLD
jgi:hypothetical protein